MLRVSRIEPIKIRVLAMLEDGEKNVHDMAITLGEPERDIRLAIDRARNVNDIHIAKLGKTFFALRAGRWQDYKGNQN